MGSSQSNSGNKDLDNNLRIVERKTQSPFGEFNLMIDLVSKDLVIQKELLFQTESEATKEKQYLDQRSEKSHPSIITVLGTKLNSETHLCSKTFKISWIVEYLTRDLKSEIDFRRERNINFTDEEIWFLLMSLVSGLGTLQENSISHGSLSSSTVFITDKGNVKVTDPSILKSINNYAEFIGEKNLKNMKKNIYFAPELLKNLSEKFWTPQSDVYKSDVFTLGMIILEAATLSTCDDLYNWDKYTIEEDKLRMRFEHLKERQEREIKIIIIFYID
jgi:serine/threonine protein kinase